MVMEQHKHFAELSASAMGSILAMGFAQTPLADALTKVHVVYWSKAETHSIMTIPGLP